MHRSDVGDLRPVRIFLHIVNDLSELAGQKAIGIGQRQQQGLHVQSLGRRIGRIGRYRCLMQAPLSRKRVDRVGIVPCTRRHGRVGHVTVDQHARRALQTAMDQRHDQAIAAEQKALVSLPRQQVLVSGRKLAGQDERGLGCFEGVAGQRMRCA
jgi:hypothetical protein